MIDREHEAYKKAKTKQRVYQPEILENGDSLKQLMTGSRYTLYKSRDKWTDSQKMRACLLFERYPDLELAYQLSDDLRKIYNQDIEPNTARLKLARWFDKIEKVGLNSFNSIKRTF